MKRYNFNENEIRKFREYVNKCSREGFTGPNDYSRVNSEREAFMKWHLVQIMSKVSGKGQRILFNDPEVRTLLNLFKRVDCDKETIKLQDKFYNRAG